MAMFVGSTTPLAGNASWTSFTKLRDRHDTVEGTVFSDKSGTLNIEQSMDGTWDNDNNASGKVDLNTSVSVTGDTGASFNVALVAPFWRLRYVNGGTAQTVFRVQATTQAGGDS